jgi:hypothetical protein
VQKMKDNEIKVGDLCVVSVGTKVLPFSNDEFSKTLSVYLGMLKHKKITMNSVTC